MILPATATVASGDRADWLHLCRPAVRCEGWVRPRRDPAPRSWSFCVSAGRPGGRGKSLGARRQVGAGAGGRAIVRLMTDRGGAPSGPDGEAGLLGALFSPAGRADPLLVLRSSPLPGCQYEFVRDVLRDPQFAPPQISPSADPAFQLLAQARPAVRPVAARSGWLAGGGCLYARRPRK